MFEKQRQWLEQFKQSEPPAAPQSAPATKQPVPAAPHGGQWSGHIPRPATGLPPGWVPIDLPGDFTEVFGYPAEEPPRRKTTPEDIAQGEADIFEQVHKEATRSASRDRMHDPEFEHTYSQQFIELQQAVKQARQATFTKAYLEQPKDAALTSIVINCGDGVVVTFDTGDNSAISLSAPGGWVSIPRSAVTALIAALLRAGGGKAHPSDNLDYNARKRVAAEYRFQEALAAGRIELVKDNGETRTLTTKQWEDKIGTSSAQVCFAQLGSKQFGSIEIGSV